MIIKKIEVQIFGLGKLRVGDGLLNRLFQLAHGTD
jgi:hypothetical protein